MGKCMYCFMKNMMEAENSNISFLSAVATEIAFVVVIAIFADMGHVGGFWKVQM